MAISAPSRHFQRYRVSGVEKLEVLLDLKRSSEGLAVRVERPSLPQPVVD